MKEQQIIIAAWQQLYGRDHEEQLKAFLLSLDDFKAQHSITPQEPEWYKDVIVYSLYVDLFNKDFTGLTEKLDYLMQLGVNCLWLLPILDSPMRDAGFDIRRYTKVRDDLLGLPASAPEEEKKAVFRNFLREARRRGIKVIFDIAMNHTSDEHPWFLESRKGPENPFRDYYIWNKDTNRYTATRLLFKGMEDSNWEPDGDWYYFHRFFSFQPDLNYRNPDVLTAMCNNLLYWVGEGVDGFRADAIPYLWKEEGTDCENLPLTHTIVKLFRAVLDYIRPNTLLLAEACQKPAEVVKYFGEGDECHAGYHFPLMPQLFKAIAMENNEPVRHTLSNEVTPPIPESAQWFTFLRCHDELSLELVYVSEEDRAYIHKNYCHQPEWDFRVGEGISARLSELMLRNPDKIALAFSIMLTLPGTPIIYYGDEFGKLNDEAYYQQKIKETGKDDTRFLVRGKVDWQQTERDLKDENSFAGRVFGKVSQQVQVRKQHKAFGRGSMTHTGVANPDGKVNKHILAYIRKYENQRILVINNLSSATQTFKIHVQPEISWIDLFGATGDYDEKKQYLTMPPYAYLWLKL
jgi:maltose alpha-D-glucosyltransferase / alpha-amylase